MAEYPQKKLHNRQKFQLYQHPWLSVPAVIAAFILSMIFTGSIIFGLLQLPEWPSWTEVVLGIAYYSLTTFVLIPYVLRLPKGKRTFGQYLGDIGLTYMKPLLPLIGLGVSCYLLLMLSQVAGTMIFRWVEGLPITWRFFKQVIDITGDLPPDSFSLLVAIPSIFEEMIFRGVLLTVFLGRYSWRKAILFSSLAFGLIHLLNAFMGRDLVWVLGQVIWSFVMGLFYGYVFVKTRSLLPSMIVHYLGNAFVGSISRYLQDRGSVEVQTLYGLLFLFGILPTSLMILWTHFYTLRWLSRPAGAASPSATRSVKTG
mgnify:CR=1 FL=1